MAILETPKTLKKFSLFIDGEGFAGTTNEVELPTLEVIGEEHRAGGMDTAIEIDMGMEPLEMSFTMADFDKRLMAKVGVVGVDTYPLTFRGTLRAERNTTIPVVIHAQGRFRKVELGTAKAGDKTEPKYEMTLVYYKYTQAGEVLVEIDVLNMKRIFGGVDQLESERRDLGF